MLGSNLHYILVFLRIMKRFCLATTTSSVSPAGRGPLGLRTSPKTSSSSFFTI
ncbi:unnamed protein product [Larinioides sclopetarius]|uniref:Uncharacterized protein n=1 Tax=Larinioides sclopetarius TaxID=280406 RepID=A0AAV2AXS3_9ARAC